MNGCSTLVRALTLGGTILGLAAMAGCGTPSPEKVCARYADLSKRTLSRCVPDLTAEQTASPEKYKTRAACVMAAPDGPAVDACFEDEARAREAAAAAADRALADKAAELDKLMAELKSNDADVKRAQAQLTAAKSDGERDAAKAKLAAAQARYDATTSKMAAVRNGKLSGAASGTPRPACTCAANDPLCSCL